MLKTAKSVHHLHINAAYWLTISGGVLIAVMLIGAHMVFPGGYPDPFIPYQTIQPGQPITALGPYGCQTEQFPEHIKMRVCRITAVEETPFSAILVWTFDGAIQKVTYYGDTLQVVDLVQHFGKPTKVSVNWRYYILNWGNEMIALVPKEAHGFTYHLRVLYLKRALTVCNEESTICLY